MVRGRERKSPEGNKTTISGNATSKISHFLQVFSSHLLSQGICKNVHVMSEGNKSRNSLAKPISYNSFVILVAVVVVVVGMTM